MTGVYYSTLARCEQHSAPSNEDKRKLCAKQQNTPAHMRHKHNVATPNCLHLLESNMQV